MHTHSVTSDIHVSYAAQRSIQAQSFFLLLANACGRGLLSVGCVALLPCVFTRNPYGSS